MLKDIINTSAIRRLFNLTEDAQAPEAVIDEVSRNVVFRGTNLWILIFAIMICSVGLNVNSTAVIIGAMLISPLMGPIIGVGVGVGIFDVSLIRKAARNLLVAVVISIASSALYFLITPLSGAQSELLARTSPTLWDVLIAMFGGLAGIVGVTRKEKTNVIPGVAIATALMPPLCTAGFGLATGSLSYFLGALYLFFINAVFISVSAFLLIRFLRFPTKQFIEKAKERQVRLLVGAVVLITVVPSIYLAYVLVDRTLFERKAEQFVATEFDQPNARVVEKRIIPEKNNRTVEIYMLGEPISENEILRITSRMASYGLNNTQLKVHQGRTSAEQVDVNALRSDILKDLYAQNQAMLLAREEKINALQDELSALRGTALPTYEIIQELKAQHPSIEEFTMNRNTVYRKGRLTADTALVALAWVNGKVSREEMDRLRNWLKVRTHMDSVIVIVQ